MREFSVGGRGSHDGLGLTVSSLAWWEDRRPGPDISHLTLSITDDERGMYAGTRTNGWVGDI